MRLGTTRLLALVVMAAFAAPMAAHAQAKPAAGAPSLTADLMQKRSAQFDAQKKASTALARQDPAKLRSEGTALTTELAPAAGIQCTVTDALNLGSAEFTVGRVKSTTRGAEAACSDGPGWILLQAGTDKAEAFDCLAVAKSPLACRLPGNANPARTMQPLLTKAKSDCIVADAQYVGELPTMIQYELKCENGTGAILQVTRPQTADSKLQAASCFLLSTAGGKYPCKMTTEEANLAPVKALATKSTVPCTPAKQRYVMSTMEGSVFYEFACADGSGQMIEANAKGDYARTLQCAQASAVGGGCTLTAGAPKLTNADYTTLIKTAGTNCDVSKFAGYAPKTDGSSGVEVVCAGGTGGVLVTKDSKATFFSCGRSEAETYRCTLSPATAGYSTLTAQLKEKGKNTCTVSGIAPAASASAAYIEVACSDGAPGFMMRYARDSNTPSDVFTCPEYKARTGGNGGCRMPSNIKS